MKRSLGLLFSTLVYLAFLAVFSYTMGFVGNLQWLPKTIDAGGASTAWPLALGINVLLLALFAIQHSVMARRGFKRQWTKIVPQPFERSVFVLAATLVVALLIWQWRPMPSVVWSVESDIARVALLAASALGWITVLASTFLINHFELFGLHQAVAEFRGRSFESPSFKTPGLYKLMRHPLYAGFVLAFWATPVMTAGHLLWAGVTTGYIFVGIWFEERDLIAHFGDVYRDYQKRVPMLLPLRRARREQEVRRQTTA